MEKRRKRISVSSLNYHRNVTSFDVGDGRIGIHVSSSEYSRTARRRLPPAVTRFSCSSRAALQAARRPHQSWHVHQVRERAGGCFAASHSSFLLSDINGDGLLDIRVAREKLTCQEVGQNSVERPFYEEDPIRWYVLNGSEWKYDQGLDRRLPGGRFSALPLIGITTSPIDYVKRINQRQ